MDLKCWAQLSDIVMSRSVEKIGPDWDRHTPYLCSLEVLGYEISLSQAMLVMYRHPGFLCSVYLRRQEGRDRAFGKWGTDRA